MTGIHIKSLGRDLLPDARRLVWRVFPQQNPIERISFWFIANRDSSPMRLLMKFGGVAEILDFWGAIDNQTGKVVGTTGLYSYINDAAEAVWLAWFCVAPEVRKRGIGSQLLDFSIAEARKTGRRYLRLYTSDDLIESAAQRLYESRGLKIVRKQRRLFYTKIYRELYLDTD